MVGNKAQKAVAAALTGVLTLGTAAPAFAGMWTDGKDSWFRVDGSHQVNYQLGTYDLDDDGEIKDAVSGAMSGTELVKGETRYDTAFDAIDYNYAKYKGTRYVVLASGTSQADTLVASGVAGMLKTDEDQTKGVDVPVMITPADGLGQQAERVIKNFAKGFDGEGGDFTVYIVGGEAAVSKAVEDAVADIKGGTDKKEISVERVAGDDRMATSLEAAKVVDPDAWLDEDLAAYKNVVFVANGTAWPDALSVSSFAYSLAKPIMLTSSDGKLTADQLDYLLKLDDSVGIMVIGGPAQPSAQQLWDAGAKRASVLYKAGTNRYETSALVIDEMAEALGETTPFATIAVASGNEAHWADALIGGPFVGANEGVLALVDGVDEVTALKAAYAHQKDVTTTSKKERAKAGASSYIMGGESAIDATFAKKLNKNFPTK